MPFRCFLLPCIAVVLATLTVAFPGEDRAVPEDATKERVIPLSAIYGTNHQEGINRLRPAKANPAHEALKALTDDAGYIGAGTVFLVRGKDITEAIRAMRLIYAEGQSADQVATARCGSKDAPLWMVAFMGGVGSRLPRVVVKSACQNGKRVRLTYSTPNPPPTDGNYIAEFFWVPLNAVGEGTYSLELYHEQSRQVVLMRRVTVTPR